jgi:DNA-binding transcriptional LysR family regulator
MSLDQRQLRAFLAIVDLGSLGRAAQEISLSQPALSRLIAEMEARLGAGLFERHGKGMTLTSFGEVLLPHARHLLFEMAQAREALLAVQGLKRGKARIGAVATIARSVLPGAIDRLLKAAPELSVELVEAEDDRLLLALERREVDLAIARDLAEQDEVIAVAECEFDDRYSVFCAASHPLASAGPVSIAEVMNEKWVLSAAGSTPRALFDDLVRSADAAAPRVALETWSTNAAIACVAQTQFLGWLPRPLFSGEEAAGTVRALDVPQLSLPRRFLVYKRANGLLPPAAARLLRELPLNPLPKPAR